MKIPWYAAGVCSILVLRLPGRNKYELKMLKTLNLLLAEKMRLFIFAR